MSCSSDYVPLLSIHLHILLVLEHVAGQEALLCDHHVAQVIRVRNHNRLILLSRLQLLVVMIELVRQYLVMLLEILLIGSLRDALSCRMCEAIVVWCMRLCIGFTNHIAPLQELLDIVSVLLLVAPRCRSDLCGLIDHLLFLQ